MEWIPPVRQWRVRVLALLLAPMLLAAVACDDDAGASEEVIAPAVDACSRVGATGDVAPCRAAVDVAREQCGTLSSEERARCATDLDELLVAAQEAAHLFHGECDAMSSEAARSACDLAASLTQPSPTATPPPPVIPTAAPTEVPAADSEAAPGPLIAGALWACGLLDGSGRDAFEEACEQALENARDVCDRLADQAEDQCRSVLDGLEARGAAGPGDREQDSQDNGDGNGRNGNGNNGGSGNDSNGGNGNNGGGRGRGNR